METQKQYTSDLSDKQWRYLKPHIPEALPGGRHRSHDMRAIVNAIMYRVKNGCIWQDLPHDFPPHQSVYEYYRAWTLDGTWEKIHALLRDSLRLKLGRSLQPSAALLTASLLRRLKKGGFRLRRWEEGKGPKTAYPGRYLGAAAKITGA